MKQENLVNFLLIKLIYQNQMSGCLFGKKMNGLVAC